MSLTVPSTSSFKAVGQKRWLLPFSLTVPLIRDPPGIENPTSHTKNPLKWIGAIRFYLVYANSLVFQQHLDRPSFILNQCKTMSLTGRIHSIETCGTVDGPGLRFVVFTQGCPLRCLYCHNPDCREVTGGREVTVEELMEEIDRYASYIKNGGVTVTGGEPMMQPEFVTELLHQCQLKGIHTAIDTSGYVTLEAAKPILDRADLVLLDIKSFDPTIYRRVTSVSLQPTLNFAKHLQAIGKPTWIRFVLVPDLTDPRDNVAGLAEFIGTLDNVERVEVLPFHKMGEYKWEALGYPYQLQNTPPPTPEAIANTVQQFEKRGLTVVV